LAPCVRRSAAKLATASAFHRLIHSARFRCDDKLRTGSPNLVLGFPLLSQGVGVEKARIELQSRNARCIAGFSPAVSVKEIPQVTRDTMPGGQTVSLGTRISGACDLLCDLSRHQVELGRHLAKLGKRMSIHFLHRPAAVDLHGCLGDTDIAGNLLAKAPLCDVNHNFLLPGT
jgi:hypothetical protein